MKDFAAFALATVALLAGCTKQAAPLAETAAHYTVGDPYLIGGVWRYPHADFADDETGLAAVTGDHGPANADGERYDPTAMAAGHRTLQLPAIVRVTNLDTGLSALIRLDDRGPAAPGRLIEVTPRAAELLHIQDGSRVRVQVLEGESRQLAAQLGDGGTLPLARAPAESVTAEDLAPPAGESAAARVRRATSGITPRAVAIGTTSTIPQRLPEQVSQGPAQGGALYVNAAAFSRLQYARILEARLAGMGATIATDPGAPKDRAVVVRFGPFATVAEADAALDRALKAGVTDPSITVGL